MLEAVRWEQEWGQCWVGGHLNPLPLLTFPLPPSHPITSSFSRGPGSQEISKYMLTNEVSLSLMSPLLSRWVHELEPVPTATPIGVCVMLLHVPGALGPRTLQESSHSVLSVCRQGNLQACDPGRGLCGWCWMVSALCSVGPTSGRGAPPSKSPGLSYGQQHEG